MTVHSTLRSLDEVAAHLPFHVDDVDAANATFLRWHTSGEREDLALVELWTYCYTRRYFVAKFLRDSAYSASHLDILVGKAYQRARSNVEKVKQPERYASWVSVICKNTFINFLRRYRGEQTTLDENRTPAEERPEQHEHDRLMLYRAAERAIDRLPPSLQDIARMRLLESRSYDYIVEQTGRPKPSVRSYVNKALTRLREDPDLLLLLRELG